MTELRGVDVSMWQGAISWPKVKENGYQFALIKATEGLNSVDPDFAANWAGAKAAGLVRGAYCFTRPEIGDPGAQAEHFVRTVGVLETGDLAAGDFETPPNVETDESFFALSWLGTVEAACGFPPLVYANQDWARNRLRNAALAHYPLWLACPGITCPSSIGVWSQVAISQYSWTMNIPGIGGNVDGDELARTLDGLRALGKGPVTLKTLRAVGLKREPNHTCPAVANLPAGAIVAPDGAQTTHWLHCHTGHASGWLLKADLGPAT